MGLPGGLSGCQLATLASTRRLTLETLPLTDYAEAQLPGESAALVGVAVQTWPFTLERLLAQIDLPLSRLGNQPPR